MSFYRGSSIKFTGTFKTVSNGNPLVPDTVRVYLEYRVLGVTTNIDYAMTNDGSGTFFYDWDSIVADVGNVKWKVRGVSGAFVALNGNVFSLHE